MRDPAIRVILLPKDTNSRGTIFGGILLSHLDLAGAVEAARNTNQRFVTVALKEVVFRHPVHVGEVVSFYTATKRIGNTSITVKVDVEVNRGDEEVKVTEAEVTYVCVNAEGRPVPVVLKERR
jgi:acyl-CoA thioesterase YciA